MLRACSSSHRRAHERAPQAHQQSEQVEEVLALLHGQVMDLWAMT